MPGSAIVTAGVAERVIVVAETSDRIVQSAIAGAPAAGPAKVHIRAVPVEAAGPGFIAGVTPPGIAVAVEVTAVVVVRGGDGRGDGTVGGAPVPTETIGAIRAAAGRVSEGSVSREDTAHGE